MGLKVAGMMVGKYADGVYIRTNVRRKLKKMFATYVRKNDLISKKQLYVKNSFKLIKKSNPF
jgi:hypothetical protein